MIIEKQLARLARDIDAAPAVSIAHDTEIDGKALRRAERRARPVARCVAGQLGPRDEARCDPVELALEMVLTRLIDDPWLAQVPARAA